MVVSQCSVRMGNKDDGCITMQCWDVASGQVLKTTVASGHSIRTGNEDVVASGCSVRTGHEDDGSIRMGNEYDSGVTTQHQDGLNMTVLSRCSVRMGNEDNGSVGTQRQDRS
jgi:hypothetical protein